MREEKFTPGPWKFLDPVVVDLEFHQRIAWIEERRDMQANARLIAEAPAMFALIKQGLDLDKNEQRQCPCHLCEAGRAIVARVLGEE